MKKLKKLDLSVWIFILISFIPMLTHVVDTERMIVLPAPISIFSMCVSALPFVNGTLYSDPMIAWFYIGISLTDLPFRRLGLILTETIRIFISHPYLTHYVIGWIASLVFLIIGHAKKRVREKKVSFWISFSLLEYSLVLFLSYSIMMYSERFYLFFLPWYVKLVYHLYVLICIVALFFLPAIVRYYKRRQAVSAKNVVSGQTATPNQDGTQGTATKRKKLHLSIWTFVLLSLIPMATHISSGDHSAILPIPAPVSFLGSLFSRLPFVDVFFSTDAILAHAYRELPLTELPSYANSLRFAEYVDFFVSPSYPVLYAVGWITSLVFLITGYAKKRVREQKVSFWISFCLLEYSAILFLSYSILMCAAPEYASSHPWYVMLAYFLYLLICIVVPFLIPAIKRRIGLTRS